MVPQNKAESSEFDLNSTTLNVSLDTESTFYHLTVDCNGKFLKSCFYSFHLTFWRALRTWFMTMRKWIWMLTNKEEFKHLIAYVPSKTYPWYLMYLLNCLIKWLCLDYMTNEENSSQSRFFIDVALAELFYDLSFI